MKLPCLRLLLAAALLCAATGTKAAINCTAPTSTGFATAYTGPAGTVSNITQGTVTFTCTRGVVGDDLTVLLRANNGANALGVQNRVRLGATANRLNYEAYKDSTCTTLWTSLLVGDFMTIPLANNLLAQPISVSFWGCLPLGQAVAAGTYTDTVTMRVRNAANTQNRSPNGTFAVSVVAPASCSLTTPPGDVLFAYTAFGAAADASTTFQTNCTNRLPYTMSLDAYVGIVGGLVYTLNINTPPPPAGSLPVNSRGTGVAQTHTIYGNMVSGQAGDCAGANATACAATKTDIRSLTVTY